MYKITKFNWRIISQYDIQYGLYDILNKKQICKNMYDDIIGDISNNQPFIIKKNHRIGIMRCDGRILVNLHYGILVSEYVDNYCVFISDSQCFIYDINGNIILKTPDLLETESTLNILRLREQRKNKLKFLNDI